MKVAFYKATRPGLQGIFSRLVRWWTGGPYSHCELVLEERDGLARCATSSFIDGGVRIKWMQLKPSSWDVVELDRAPAEAREWFFDHLGQGYDVIGIIGFVWRRRDGHKRRWFCSESIAAALGLGQPWRYCPNTLHALLSSLPIVGRVGHDGARG